MPKLTQKQRDAIRTGRAGSLPQLQQANLPDLEDLPDPLAQQAEPIADPLAEVEYRGDTEADSAAEMAAVEKAFDKNSAASVSAWMLDAFDSEYWVCFCFQTRAQKEEFLHKAGLFALGDKYIDGRKAAKKLGFPVRDDSCAQRPARVDKRYAAIARED